MKISGVQEQQYGVIGLGKTGIATIEALIQSGAQVFAWDDDAKKREALQLVQPNCSVTKAENWHWNDLQALVLSPGIPLYYPKPHPAVALAKDNGVAIIGDIELLQQAQARASYIGITGTNGKSTTTSLIGHIFETLKQPSAVGGNLGQAVMQLPALDAEETYILELSSYQLDLCQTTRFGVAVWLNLSPDHLDRHGDLEGYINAKKRIFNHQQTGDVAILGVDDAPSKKVYEALIQSHHPARVIPISTKSELDDGVYVKDGMLHDHAFANCEFDISDIPTLQGEHNYQNAAAAYAASVASGLNAEDVMQAMRHYPGLKHRMQWLEDWRGLTFVNDSKATNADATEKALSTYDHIYWIVGGVAKAGGIESLKPYFKKIKKAYVIGEATDVFAKLLEKEKVNFAVCETIENSVKQASQDALKHQRDDETNASTILLSPAAASFDQYANFEARGDDFIAQVARVKRSIDQDTNGHTDSQERAC